MLQNRRLKLIQGFILDPAISNVLQDEYESCAPMHASQGLIPRISRSLLSSMFGVPLTKRRETKPITKFFGQPPI
jgi:hypothetical protein